MSVPAFSPRIGIFGSDETSSQLSRGCTLWPAGYAAAITEAGGTPVPLDTPSLDSSWDETLEGFDGILFLGNNSTAAGPTVMEERLCRECQEQGIPFLGVDHGLHALNNAFGGTLHLNLARDLPQALQHQHLPEPGDRHAITTVPGTRLEQLYGEGEITVNSEHRRAVCRLARGFRVGGLALDGVIEAIEAETEGWFAMGVQWLPASASASGLDIQIFRGLIEACRERQFAAAPAPQLVAA